MQRKGRGLVIILKDYSTKVLLLECINLYYILNSIFIRIQNLHYFAHPLLSVKLSLNCISLHIYLYVILNRYTLYMNVCEQGC